MLRPFRPGAPYLPARSNHQLLTILCSGQMWGILPPVADFSPGITRPFSPVIPTGTDHRKAMICGVEGPCVSKWPVAGCPIFARPTKPSTPDHLMSRANVGNSSTCASPGLGDHSPLRLIVWKRDCGSPGLGDSPPFSLLSSRASANRAPREPALSLPKGSANEGPCVLRTAQSHPSPLLA